MPIYEYECETCGEKFEHFRWADEDDKNLRCPKCGDEKIKKLMSSFSKRGVGNSCPPKSFG